MLLLFAIMSRLKYQNKLAQRKTRARFGYFFLRYNSENWFWEFVLITRQVCVPFLFGSTEQTSCEQMLVAVLVTMFSAQDQKFTQVSLAFFIFMGYLALQVIRRPFVEYNLNMCEPRDLRLGV